MVGQLSHAIVELLAGSRRAMHAAEIATALGAQRKALAQALDDLVFDGVLVQHSGRRYRLIADVHVGPATLVEGTLNMNPRGFGFVKTLGTADDVFVAPDSIGGAMHGDRVSARVVTRSSRGPEGEVIEVLDRGRTRVVGMIVGRRGQRRLEPDDSRIRGPIDLGDAEDGDAEDAAVRDGLAAVIEITRYPDQPRELPRGKLVAILGEPGEPDVEVAKVLAANNVDEDHSPACIAEAEAFGSAPDPAELARRVDLRDVPLITIDPSDARDHDDAVWVERDDAGRYKAWIAIADVSHYVQTGSALDREALTRGCSIYLPDRAIPMLPHALSAKLCSLLPEVERLCLCVEIDLDATGEVKRSRIVEGKMIARAFLSYEAVARALGFTTLPARDEKAEAMRHDLRVAWDLASLRHTKRMRRGALDLDVPEARISVDDETRAPVAITQRSDDPGVRKAYRLVEEMMLLANETVAKHVIEHEIGSIFRVHGAPDVEKIERFAAACSLLGITFDPEDAGEPQKLSRFLRRIESHEKKTIVHGLLLRSMQQASYDINNLGHFGLASTAYLHFTSPIRRYPDLIVHRELRRSLRKERARESEETLRRAAQLASERERDAMAVEREVGDLYRALYMKQHIGENFVGTVSSITPGGVWLRIADPFVDVLVSTDGLGQDDYQPDDAGLRIVGRRSGDTISLGDEMLVVIEDVSIVRRAVYARRLQADGTDRPRQGERDGRGGRDNNRRARRGKTRTTAGGGKGRKGPGGKSDSRQSKSGAGKSKSGAVKSKSGGKKKGAKKKGARGGKRR